MTEEIVKKPRQVRKQTIESGKVSWSLLERILKHYWEFKALLEAEGTSEITLDNGVVLNFYDMLRGLDDLPADQREVINLICLKGYTEVECAKEIGLTSKYSSKAGDLKRTALKYLCATYWSEEELNGTNEK